MANVTHVDEYVLLTFEHNNSSAMIYVEKPIGLTFFQIDMLESFFKRMIFYCGVGTNIDINIQRLKSEEIYITSYFYNKNQDYDFCGTFEDIFIALHNCLSALFDLSVNNQYPYTSIDSDYGYNQDYDDEDYDEDEEDGQEKRPKSKQEKDLKKLGRAVDEIFKNKDKEDGQPLT